MKKILLIGGGVLLVIFAIGLFAGSSDTQETTKTTEQKGEQQETNQETEQTETKAPVSKSYQKVFTFSGEGAKKSEPFTISGERFKIKYDCKGSLCQASLYETEDDFKGLIMNVAGSTKDETIFYGEGTYYMDFNSLGNYTITVEDYK